MAEKAINSNAIHLKGMAATIPHRQSHAVPVFFENRTWYYDSWFQNVDVKPSFITDIWKYVHWLSLGFDDSRRRVVQPTTKLNLKMYKSSFTRPVRHRTSIDDIISTKPRNFVPWRIWNRHTWYNKKWWTLMGYSIYYGWMLQRKRIKLIGEKYNVCRSPITNGYWQFSCDVNWLTNRLIHWRLH